MKKALLIIGIILIVAFVLALIVALFFRYSYLHVLDGSQALYDRLHRRMIIGFVTSGVLALLSAVCFIIRAKM